MLEKAGQVARALLGEEPVGKKEKQRLNFWPLLKKAKGEK